MSNQSRTFSKGTLGLKFMQRVIAAQPTPSSAASASSTTLQPQASTSALSTKKDKYVDEVRRKSSDTKGKVKEEDHEQRFKVEERSSDARREIEEDWSVGSTSTDKKGKRRIIQSSSSSLLDFPMLSTSTTTTNNSKKWSNASSANRPIYAGRLSFGGANPEIEELHNPTPKSILPNENDSKASSSKKKERSIQSISNQSSNRRRPDPSSQSHANNKNNKKRTSSEGNGSIKEETLSPKGNKKPKLEKRFLKPAGMERSLLSKKPSSEKRNKHGKVEDIVWKEKGERRDWDDGKAESRSKQSDSQSDDDGIEIEDFDS